MKKRTQYFWIFYMTIFLFVLVYIAVKIIPMYF